MTILEMLDALEAGISAIGTESVPVPPRQASAEAAAELRAGLHATGISASEFARAAGVPRDDVEAWLAGATSVPHWVPAAIQLIALLTPSALHKLLHCQAGAPARRANSHPFARIEDL